MEKIKKIFNKKVLIWSIALNLLVCGMVCYADTFVKADVTVYITETGSKYHAYACGNGTYYESTLSYAQSIGLTECSKCGDEIYYSNESSDYDSDYYYESEYDYTYEEPETPKPIKINKTSVFLLKGQSTKLTIKNATEDVKWSSTNKSVATVSSNGKVTAKKGGKAVIIAKVGSKQKKCTVTVEALKLSKKKVTLIYGKSKKIKLSGCKHTIKWSTSNSSIAKVKKGKITTKGIGTAKITATVHNKKYICKVTVKQPKLKKLKLSKKSVKMEYNDQVSIKVKTNPKNAVKCYKVSVSSSKPSVVKAKFKNGKVVLITKRKKGTAEIKVKVGKFTKKIKVTVIPRKIKSLKFNNKNLTLKPEELSTIKYTVNPYDVPDYYDAKWTSTDESVVEVTYTSDYGRYADIEAVGEGEADVILKFGNKSVKCHVKVAKPTIKSLTLSETNITLKPEELSAIKYTVNPYDVPDYYNAEWRSTNESVVEITYTSDYGRYADIEAVGEGEADIILKFGNKSVKCHVKVAKPTIKSLTLSETNITLKPEELSTIKYTVNPYDVPDYYEAKWTSTNESVVKVTYTSDYGRYADIEAVGEGEADIILKFGNKSVKCHVKVAKPTINSLTLSETNITLSVGDWESIYYTVNPYDAPDYYNAEWTSSDESVVKITYTSEYGGYADIEAVGKGSVYITLTMGDKSVKCYVVVT